MSTRVRGPVFQSSESCPFIAQISLEGEASVRKGRGRDDRDPEGNYICRRSTRLVCRRDYILLSREELVACLYESNKR